MTLNFVEGCSLIHGSPINGSRATSRVSSANDDAEERLSNGYMYFDSSDLELTNDSDYFGPQLVGMRFKNSFFTQ